MLPPPTPVSPDWGGGGINVRPTYICTKISIISNFSILRLGGGAGGGGGEARVVISHGPFEEFTNLSRLSAARINYPRGKS